LIRSKILQKTLIPWKKVCFLCHGRRNIKAFFITTKTLFFCMTKNQKILFFKMTKLPSIFSLWKNRAKKSNKNSDQKMRVKIMPDSQVQIHESVKNTTPTPDSVFYQPSGNSAVFFSQNFPSKPFEIEAVDRLRMVSFTSSTCSSR